MNARCERCGRVISIDDDEYPEWEAIEDGDPESDRMICSGCITGVEQSQIDDQASEGLVIIESDDDKADPDNWPVG